MQEQMHFGSLFQGRKEMLSMRIDAYNQVAQLYGIQKNLKTQKAQNAAGPRNLLVSPLQESTLLESLTQVGCHRNTTLYSIRFIDELMLSFTVNYRKTEGVSAHADGESCLLNVVTFYLHICYQLPALLLSVVKSPILSPG